jgi:hypothetical protein
MDHERRPFGPIARQRVLEDEMEHDFMPARVYMGPDMGGRRLVEIDRVVGGRDGMSERFPESLAELPTHRQPGERVPGLAHGPACWCRFNGCGALLASFCDEEGKEIVAEEVEPAEGIDAASVQTVSRTDERAPGLRSRSRGRVAVGSEPPRCDADRVRDRLTMFVVGSCALDQPPFELPGIPSLDALEELVGPAP